MLKKKEMNYLINKHTCNSLTRHFQAYNNEANIVCFRFDTSHVNINAKIVLQTLSEPWQFYKPHEM